MLKQLPQGERYLSGTVSEYVSDSATSFDVNNPPAADKLPTYFELEPDSDDNRELIRVIGVSGNTITVERGIDNGGTGTEHQTNSAYKQKITSRHWDAVVDAIESGYLTEDTSFTFSQVSSSTFRIAASGDDRTGIYTAGRRVRLNGSIVCRVVSSSYSNPNTDVVTDGTSVPASITSIEVELGTANNTNSYPVKDEDTMASDSATALASQQSIKSYTDNYGNINSLYRQAIINGNFDVWQRTTSQAITSSQEFSADRWRGVRGSGIAGYTISRQDGTGVYGSRYCARCQRTASNTSTNSFYLTYGGLETANSILLRGKKLTLSFYARKGADYSAANDTLTSIILSGTGTDEPADLSYTGQATVATQSNTLTTSWQKFTMTSSAVIADTVNELTIAFSCVPVGTAGAADYFEVTQVQLCAGSVALPFMPKSFEEELRACQRYFRRINAESTYNHFLSGLVVNSTTASFSYTTNVSMRTAPTFAYSGNLRVYDPTTQAVTALVTLSNSGKDSVQLNATVASGLTDGRGAILGANNDATAYIEFIAEL